MNIVIIIISILVLYYYVNRPTEKFEDAIGEKIIFTPDKRIVYPYQEKEFDYGDKTGYYTINPPYVLTYPLWASTGNFIENVPRSPPYF